MKKIIGMDGGPRKNFNTASMTQQCLKTDRLMRILEKLIMAVCCMSVFTSCIYINSSGYESLTKAERDKVVTCQGDIADLRNDGRVYLITTEQLQEHLRAGRERVLLYEYLYYCKSEYCVSPLAVEQDCQHEGVQFLLIMENYEGIRGLPTLQSPILAVNPAPFGSKMTKGCTSKFFDQLTSTTYKTRGYGRYFLFVAGKYVGCFDDYKDALNTKF